MFTETRFAPIAENCFIICAFMPSMTETMVMTAAMPMKIERIVSALRPFLPAMDFHAILNACKMFTANPPPAHGPR